MMEKTPLRLIFFLSVTTSSQKGNPTFRAAIRKVSKQLSLSFLVTLQHPVDPPIDNVDN